MILPPETDDDYWAMYFDRVFMSERCRAVPVELDPAPADIITSRIVQAIYVHEGRFVVGRTQTRYFLVDWYPSQQTPRCWVALNRDLFLAFAHQNLPSHVFRELLKGMEVVP